MNVYCSYTPKRNDENVQVASKCVRVSFSPTIAIHINHSNENEIEFTNVVIQPMLDSFLIICFRSIQKL